MHPHVHLRDVPILWAWLSRYAIDIFQLFVRIWACLFHASCQIIAHAQIYLASECVFDSNATAISYWCEGKHPLHRRRELKLMITCRWILRLGAHVDHHMLCYQVLDGFAVAVATIVGSQDDLAWVWHTCCFEFKVSWNPIHHHEALWQILRYTDALLLYSNQLHQGMIEILYADIGLVQELLGINIV